MVAALLLVVVAVVAVWLGVGANSAHTVTTNDVTKVPGGVSVTANPTASGATLAVLTVVIGGVSALAAVASAVIAVVALRAKRS